MADIKIPRGWERVTKGMAKKGDKAWNQYTGKFATPESWIQYASRFICLIRRKPAPAKKAAKVQCKIIPYIGFTPTPWAVALYGPDYRGNLQCATRAEARRIRDAVLAALNGEG